MTDWQSTRVWRALLRAVNPLMRAEWHRPVSSTMMVLTFEGIRSGKTYSFPVGYAEEAEGLVTFTQVFTREPTRPLDVIRSRRRLRGGGQARADLGWGVRGDQAQRGGVFGGC